MNLREAVKRLSRLIGNAVKPASAAIRFAFNSDDEKAIDEEFKKLPFNTPRVVITARDMSKKK